jgi:hypothetical protein
MTPEEMDRVLAEELTVEPSPDFVARVRARMAAEPAPARWNRWWPAAAAVAAVALFAVGELRINDEAGQQSTGARVATEERPTVSAQPSRAARVEQAGPVAAVARDAQRRLVVPRSSPRPFPEVLLSADDTGAVQLLLVDPPGGIAPLAADDSAQRLTVARIDLPLIEVTPLAELTLLEPGERQ